MSKFLLQSDALELEEQIVKELIEREKYIHSYEEYTFKELNEIEHIDALPIGTIEFVTMYLGKSGFKKEIPIEIPKYLQTEEFLKRDYKIVKGKDLPRVGRYFIKNASKLKDFSVCTDMQYFLTDEMFDYKANTQYDNTLSICTTDNFVVSSVYEIKAEYRVYVIDNEIVNISHYNGNPLILPDIKLLQKAVALIEYNEKWLKSYTIDIMVGNKGTAIIEIHNFTSVGLYNTVWGTNLLYAYRDGIEYLKNDNSIKYL